MSETENKKEIMARAYRDNEQMLLRRSFYKISDRDLADDLVQTTFLKTWKYLLKDKQIDSVRGFLFHVLDRLIIDEYRKKKQISLDSMMESGFQVEFDNSERLFDQLDGKAAILLIPLLEDKYEKVISMRFEEEMTIKEIAKATQQPDNTVVVQIHRGIDKLAILVKIDKKNRAEK
ncbi:MAG: RNA polymerase sigma factor [Patescibacteria group bacterium]